MEPVILIQAGSAGVKEVRLRVTARKRTEGLRLLEAVMPVLAGLDQAARASAGARAATEGKPAARSRR